MQANMWTVGLVILVVGLLPLWIAWLRVGRRKRYFHGGAADPHGPTRPAPADGTGRLRTVVEVDDFDPITPVAPDEVPREPQIPETGPAREGSPGWSDVTEPPPTAGDRDGDPRHPGPGRHRP